MVWLDVCLQKTTLECGIKRFRAAENCSDHAEHGAVQDAVPSAERGENEHDAGQRGQPTGDEPVTREQLQAFDGDVVAGTSLLGCRAWQAQHVTERLDDAETGRAHERLR